ncbi:MAG: LysR family transcriptional regulator [Litoreibacter sp.]|nr:LysR family transcriptional regulator [Litoreibacter sp.]MCY4334753.1 LysR family transcriptional regulator [Litoreibacter sp.]
MPRQLPPLNALRAFEAAGRHESFSRAAEELGVSHSAISKHVRGLEDRLGAQLFRDAARGVVLSPQGRAYLDVLTPAFDAIAEATEEFSDRPAGTVTVNSETVFAYKWLVQKLKGFHQAHPGITVELDATETLIDIQRYEADIAIRFFRQTTPDGNAVLVSDAPIAPYAAPSIAAQIGDAPETLFDFPMLRDRGGDPWGLWFTSLGRADLAARMPHTRRMRAILAVETVIAEQGVLLSSLDNIELDVEAGRLVRVFNHAVQHGAYYMLFGEGVLRRKPVRLFRDWLLLETKKFRSAAAVS